MKFTRNLLLLPAALIIGACAFSDTPNFINMTDEQVFAYNLDKPVMDRVYCFVETPTGSYIRRRKCMTVQNYVTRLQKSYDQLSVLQPSHGGTSSFRSNLD